MPNRHVWSHHEADLDIHLLDAGGVVVAGPPLFTYCYAEGINVAGRLDVQRRQVTGRRFLKLTAREFLYTCKIDFLYLTKAIELDATYVFKRTQRLQLVFRLTNPEYGLVTDATKQDIHTLKMAVAAEFEISSQDRNTVQASASFDAEEFV